MDEYYLITIKHFYMAGILFGAIGGKNKNRQNMRQRNTVSNSFTQ